MMGDPEQELAKVGDRVKLPDERVGRVTVIHDDDTADVVLDDDTVLKKLTLALLERDER